MTYRNAHHQPWRMPWLCPMCGDKGTTTVGARLYCNEHAAELQAFTMSREDVRLALAVVP